MSDVGGGYSARHLMTNASVPLQSKRSPQNVEHGLAARDKIRIINYIQAKVNTSRDRSSRRIQEPNLPQRFLPVYLRESKWICISQIIAA